MNEIMDYKVSTCTLLEFLNELMEKIHTIIEEVQQLSESNTEPKPREAKEIQLMSCLLQLQLMLSIFQKRFPGGINI